MENTRNGNNKVYKILLLTNRDSDNVGDQVIEASDIALIHTVMKNLGLEDSQYKVISRAAAIVTKKYIATKDPELLKNAREQIQSVDLIIFGGAPVFNYLYQTFYERTAITLELAEEYHVPVIFSAIGVERYEEENKKCQRLKKTLNFDCVRQITTRDGIDELEKYRDREDIVIDRVADPAVFAAQALKKFAAKKDPAAKKKIGIFVFRANGFKDNKLDFSKDQAAELWKDIIKELEEKGYDYSLLTSGHFGDEAYLDYLIREHNVKESKCIFNINNPENLTEKLTSFDAIISCRLHPSIIAYSFDIPSIGIVWNSKVTHFYQCIGYENRCVTVENISAKDIVEKMEDAMETGIKKDKGYLASVYRYLFEGIKKNLGLNDIEAEAYEYDQLIQEITPFAGTSDYEKSLKLQRKFRRTYENFNLRAKKIEQLKKKTNSETNYGTLKDTAKRGLRKVAGVFKS